jgi:hypothetical protein
VTGAHPFACGVGAVGAQICAPSLTPFLRLRGRCTGATGERGIELQVATDVATHVATDISLSAATSNSAVTVLAAADIDDSVAKGKMARAGRSRGKE